MPIPVVESVYPLNNQSSVVIGTTIQVVFEDEIDITTIPGNFIVEGPDTDRVTGPDMILWDDPTTDVTENILDSPNFKGIVQGTFTTELLSTDNLIYSGTDVSGGSSGDTAWKHKVIFTPDHILSPVTEYNVYVTGDEIGADGITSGISTRTVFEPVKGTNVGNGDIVATGGYTGTVDDIYRFEITKTGGLGIAEYDYFRDGDILTVRTGIISSTEVSLVGGNGLCVRFTGDSSSAFVIGDTFSVRVREPIYLTSSYIWSFTTGSGNITALPSDLSTSPIGGLGLPITAPFQILSVDPDVRDTNIALNTRVIKIVFNRTVDPDTITDNSIKIHSLPVNGDPLIPSLGKIGKILSVDGDTVYAILQSGKDPS